MQNGCTVVDAAVASPKFRIGSLGSDPSGNDAPSTSAMPFGHDPLAIAITGAAVPASTTATGFVASGGFVDVAATVPASTLVLVFGLVSSIFGFVSSIAGFTSTIAAPAS